MLCSTILWPKSRDVQIHRSDIYLASTKMCYIICLSCADHLCTYLAKCLVWERANCYSSSTPMTSPFSPITFICPCPFSLYHFSPYLTFWTFHFTSARSLHLSGGVNLCSLHYRPSALSFRLLFPTRNRCEEECGFGICLSFRFSLCVTFAVCEMVSYVCWCELVSDVSYCVIHVFQTRVMCCRLPLSCWTRAFTIRAFGTNRLLRVSSRWIAESMRVETYLENS